MKVVDLLKPFALQVDIAKESLDSAVVWRSSKIWEPLYEGLSRCWLLNTGPGREDCTARGVTGQGKDWHVLTAGMEL